MENPRPPQQRRRPDLNINTSTSYSQSKTAAVAVAVNNSTIPVPPIPTTIPQTPPSSRKPPPISSRGKSIPATRALNRVLGASNRHGHPEHSIRENQLGRIMDSDILGDKENARPGGHRDSHDLSLSPRQVTRDSLMANMLLSLDQFSMGSVGGQYGASTRNLYDSEPLFFQYENDGAAGRGSGTRPGRSNTHHTYSNSSDLEAGDDSSRVSSQPSRGRRSNSSSNFQSSLGRINSLRSQPPTTPRGLHSRGGKGSKSSSSNSIDAGYAQVLGSQRWAQGFGGRSSSFDYGNRPPSQAPPQTQQSQWNIEFSSSFLSDDYDAAPTPTIPGGPRRAPTTPVKTSYPPHPPPEPTMEPKSPGLERKRSTRSTKSLSNARKGESKFGTRAVPPMPAVELDSAPAPHVGYEKSKEAVHGGLPSSQTNAQPKERPGFFKRVFGSSRTNLSSTTLEAHNSSSQFSSTSLETLDHSNKNHIATQMKCPASPPSRDASSSHSNHVLQKRPSSFFRRRRNKSITDQAPPMPVGPASPPPITAPPRLVPPISLMPDREKASPTLEPSPVSSLRRVMSPYLKGSPTLQASPHPLQSNPLQSNPLQSNPLQPRPPIDIPTPESDRYQRDISPDYDRAPNSAIRTIKSAASQDDMSSRGPERRTDTPTRPPPEVPKMSETRNNSFLNLDGPSDNEGDSTAQPAKTPLKKSSRNGFMKDDRSPSPPSRRSTPQSTKEEPVRAIRKKTTRTRLEPADSDDEANKPSLMLPIEGARSASRASVSTGAGSKSVASVTPSVRVEESRDVSPKVLGTFESISSKPLDEPEFVVGDPTDDDRQKATKIFEGNEDFIQKEKAAAWMGEEGPVRQRTLRAYMDLYEFKNTSILMSLRQVCRRLVFRAETQQVDRILVAFSKRWCDCNPNHGFKATGK
jgi:hypothetical protein